MPAFRVGLIINGTKLLIKLHLEYARLRRFNSVQPVASQYWRVSTAGDTLPTGTRVEI